MPEYLEIHFMVEMVSQKILKIIVKRVRRLGTPYSNENSAKENRLNHFLNQLPETFTIDKVQQRGKEVAFRCNSFTILIPSFGKGAYLYFIEDASILEKEPFLSDGWIAFEGISESNKYCALIIVDCRSYRHEVEIQLKDRNNFWTLETKGPCMLNETEKFIMNFKSKLRNDPSYFRAHTVAFVIFDQKLFNGIGAYSASEILFRLYLKHKVAPFDNLWDAIMKKPGFLDDFLRSPLFFFAESENFQSKFDPANYGYEQRKLSQMFRLHFLKVFGKKSWKGIPTVALAFKTCKSIQTVFTLNPILNKLTKKPTEFSKSKKKISEASKLHLPGLEENEGWCLVRGKRFTPNDIFVGPFEWHMLSELKELQTCGLPPSTITEQSEYLHDERGPRYRRRRVKRNGRKCERNRREKIWE